MPGAVPVSGSLEKGTSTARSDGAYNEKIRRANEERLLGGTHSTGPSLNTQVSENYDETQSQVDRQNNSSLSSLQRDFHGTANQIAPKSPDGGVIAGSEKSPTRGRSPKNHLLRSSKGVRTSSSKSKSAAAATRPSNSRSASDTIDEEGDRFRDDGFSESFTRVEAFLVQDDDTDHSGRGTIDNEATRLRLEEIARREEALAERERHLQESMIAGGENPPASPITPVSATATVTATATRPMPGMAITHATPLVRTVRGESSLERIAKAFRRDIVVETHTYRMKKYKKTFTGKEAVDYFVTSGIATTRQGAALLGRRLLEELKLFHHVCATTMGRNAAHKALAVETQQ